MYLVQRLSIFVKNNVAVIIKLAEQMLLEGIEAEAYKSFS